MVSLAVSTLEKNRGTAKVNNIEMMANTTSNSISVNASGRTKPVYQTPAANAKKNPRTCTRGFEGITSISAQVIDGQHPSSAATALAGDQGRSWCLRFRHPKPTTFEMYCR
jgi:hypothetical protein